MMTASLSQMRKLQRVQNEALHWISKTYQRMRNIIQELYSLLEIEPINIFLHKQTKKIWNRLREELQENVWFSKHEK